MRKLSLCMILVLSSGLFAAQEVQQQLALLEVSFDHLMQFIPRKKEFEEDAVKKAQEELKQDGLRVFDFIKSGQPLNTIKLYIDGAGARIDQKDQSGRTMLHVAAEKKRNDVLKYLLEDKKVDLSLINAQDNEGFTALMRALQQLNDEGVRLLLTNNADVNKKNRFEETALHFAAARSPISIIESLIKAGADVNAQDKEEKTPIFQALYSLDDNALKFFLTDLSEDDIKHEDKNFNTIMHIAAERGDCSKILLISEKYSDLNSMLNHQHESPLHLLAKAKGAKAEKCIQAVFDESVINEQNVDGDTPLHLALKSDNQTQNYGLIEFLVNNGANKDITNNAGRKPTQTYIVSDKIRKLLGLPNE